ncbi:MAG: hypothetical protein SFX19_01485 [Alphaproteobacteria bacterium]|nr:hypothetical protein [Alphaproteobacteria bacterium]
MDEQLLQVGAGGMFALFVLREVFSFLKERLRTQNNTQLDIMAKQLQELHDWHAVTDEDGVKIWYLRRSLENAIEKLTNNLDIQTQLLRELVLSMKETRQDMDSFIREQRRERIIK